MTTSLAAARRRGGAVATALAVGAGLLATVASAPPAGAALPGNCRVDRELGPVICEFGFTGAEQAFTVPHGVTSVGVVATGADGGQHAQGSSTAVAVGAVASGVILTVPGQTLYIEVGGAGGDAGASGNTGSPGGWNGGGAGGDGVPSVGGGGAGGGGGTDVRTVPRDQPGTLASRLLVAGGGGGGTAYTAGSGGSAGLPGGSADGVAVGGSPGTATAPGAGGVVVVDPLYAAGGDGSEGVGGAGGLGYAAPNGNVYAAGGGGGGGRHGGGGGSSYAGGGGGSSLAAGGTVEPKAGRGPAHLTLSYQSRGPVAFLQTATPTSFSVPVGTPYRRFTVYAYDPDNVPYADVTDRVRVRRPDGTLCPSAGCVFHRPGWRDLNFVYRGVELAFRLVVVTDPALSIRAGDHQRGAAGRLFRHRLAVVATNELAEPTPGVEISFEVVRGSARFRGARRVPVSETGDDGRALAPALRAGRRPGPVTVVARADGLPRARFHLRVTAPQRGSAG